MFSAILILLIMPFIDLSRSRGIQFKPLSKVAFFLFVANFIILVELGAKHVESPFIEFGQISTVIYFAYFLIIVPLISLVENTLTELYLESDEDESLKSDDIRRPLSHYLNIAKALPSQVAIALTGVMIAPRHSNIHGSDGLYSGNLNRDNKSYGDIPSRVDDTVVVITDNTGDTSNPGNYSNTGDTSNPDFDDIRRNATDAFNSLRNDTPRP
jgi:ubiquinol-cytochrome c reductase cytochrome b subunit